MVTPVARIGLFGGSFNPAHEGHLYVSQVALEKLGLDEVWWLVSPRNPLKDEASLAPFDMRFGQAQEMAEGHPIKVLDTERQEGLFFTIDTLKQLRGSYPGNAFCWIMGADCLKEFHTWKNWEEIMASTPIAVLPRPGYDADALNGIAATKFRENRLADAEAQNLVVTTPPTWVYIDVKGLSVSATEIRSASKAD